MQKFSGEIKGLIFELLAACGFTAVLFLISLL